MVAGRNYGQGSSREHAALAPRYLGLRAVIAAGFARIHRQNLINYGVLPLVLADPGDLDRLAADDELVLPDLHAAVGRGEVRVRVRGKDGRSSAASSWRPGSRKPAGRRRGERGAGGRGAGRATGAKPADLPFPGAGLLTTAEEFLDLASLPRRLVCVGGGYISLEFAHVAARAGVQVTVLHRGPRILERFDARLVEQLTTATGEAGIDVCTDAEVTGVVRDNDDLCVTVGDGRAIRRADMVLHGAGRVPDLDDLDLPEGGVAAGPGGVLVGPDMRSRTAPAVFAVGDAADLPPQLAPTADREGEVAAANIIAGRTVRTVDQTATPSIVFTLPPLAAVGMTADEAATAGDAVLVTAGDTDGWPSSRRLGQKHAGFKVFQDAKTGRILGAHVLGHGAGEVINVFALAIRKGLTGADLKDVLWGYPTATSDIRRMVREKES